MSKESDLAKQFITESEYLVIERNSKNKNEYHKGSIYAIAGASRSHNLKLLI